MCLAGHPGANNTEAGRNCQRHCCHHISVSVQVLVIDCKKKDTVTTCLLQEDLCVVVMCVLLAKSMSLDLTACLTYLPAGIFEAWSSSGPHMCLCGSLDQGSQDTLHKIDCNF